MKDLISSQNSLKNLSLAQLFDEGRLDWTEILPSVKKHLNTIINLHLKNYRSVSFIANFTNLEELDLSSYFDKAL